MATWTDIADSVLEVDKPIRSIDHFALRDNIIAAFEKAVGAPVLANGYVVAAMMAANSVATANIIAANVTAPKLASTSSERDWILALLAGLTHGAVGTFAFARANTSVAFGSTIAGSNLTTTSAGGGGSGGSGGHVVLSGTWRCLGTAYGSANDELSTLWIRIS